MNVMIRHLDQTATLAASARLGELLADAVAGGASVGFDPGLAAAAAATWWRESVAARVGTGAVTLLAAEVDSTLVGTVQLVRPSFPNGRRRAEVAKLLVHSTFRRKGVARALMKNVEEVARADGRVLLVLDTETGSGAKNLYDELGWLVAGVIPDFALDTDGRLHATTVMYRRLR